MPSSPSRDESREQRIKRSYADLKASDYEAFRKCVRSADALAINLGLTLEQSAGVETAMVALVLETKGLR